MGKRKKSARKPVGPKKREALATSFKCPFCSNETSVSVKIERKQGIASLSCRDCGQTYQTADVHNLTVPVDVYYEWIDACDNVAKEQAATTAYAAPPVSRALAPSHRAGLAPGEKYTAEDDGFIDDDDVDAEAEYADEE